MMKNKILKPFFLKSNLILVNTNLSISKLTNNKKLEEQKDLFATMFCNCQTYFRNLVKFMNNFRMCNVICQIKATYTYIVFFYV